MAKEMTPEIRALLRLSAGQILGPSVVSGKSMDQIAQGMREMPAEFNPHKYESVSDRSWNERKALSLDWLLVFERGS